LSPKPLKKQAILFLCLLVLTVMSCPVLAVASSGVEQAYNLSDLTSQYVRDNSSWPAEDIRIDFPSKVTDVSLKGEKISYDISRGGKAMLLGNCNFLIRFFDDGVQIAKYQVRADIEVRENYVTTARVVKRNTIIEAGDLQIAGRWVRNPSLKSIGDMEAIVGKRLIMDLGPDREITKAMIKEPVLVKKGEVVRIVLDNGQMSITATGVAEEEGVDRQRIRVKNLSSQKVIIAKVMGESFVSIESF
jgi:flagellar basal body P-ring formation protein FlgA